MHVSSKRCAQIAILFLFSSAAGALSVERRATTCNGHAELCNRSFGNVTFVGAHDSYAVDTKASDFFANQDYDVTQQLNDGIRMLQMQAHNLNGTIQLCHTSCSFQNGGSLQDYLGKVKTWMDSNTNDVVSLLIVNSDGFAPSDFGSVFVAAGLDKLSYSPKASAVAASDWPTLGSLIDSSTRLVTFMDTHADFTSVPYIIDEFTNVWETAFDVTDTAFDCNVNRSKVADTSTSMYLINHFLDMEIFGQPAPNPQAANVTNSASGVGSLGQQALVTCPQGQNRYPNFMLVDFYEFGGGSVFQVAATANGVTYSPSTPIATPLIISNTSTSSTPSSTSSTKSSAPGSRAHHLTSLSALVVASGIVLGSWIVL